MNFKITEAEKNMLLHDAREAIAAKLEQREACYNSIANSESVLAVPCGAFVSLHQGSALRGCIGCMSAVKPLFETVREMAQAAAFGDPRFPPLAKTEFAECNIEISVLSPMAKCSSPDAIEIGVHGLYLQYQGKTGVLLPQVPVEQGWNRAEYLEYICIKAGTPEKAYLAAGADLRTFTAVVFGES